MSMNDAIDMFHDFLVRWCDDDPCNVEDSTDDSFNTDVKDSFRDSDELVWGVGASG
jgi:hypothetical protein